MPALLDRKDLSFPTVENEARCLLAFARRNNCLEQTRDEIAVTDAEASTLRALVQGDTALEMMVEMAIAFRKRVRVCFDFLVDIESAH